MTRGLVLLHGFTGAPQSWQGVTRALSTAPPILAPALLGHGVEGVAASDFEAEVERLAAIVQRWEEPRPHLVGYSLGARLALGLLARHAELFGSATLIGVNPGLTSEEERRGRRACDADWARLLRNEGMPAFVERWEALPLFDTQRALPDAELAAQRTLRLAHDAEGLALSLEHLGLGVMPSLWAPGLPASVDIRLLVGARDAKFLELAARFVLALPQGVLDVVPEAGHNLPLERPDAVAATIDRALGAGELP